MITAKLTLTIDNGSKLYEITFNALQPSRIEFPGSLPVVDLDAGVLFYGATYEPYVRAATSA